MGGRKEKKKSGNNTGTIMTTHLVLPANHKELDF